MKKGIGIIFIFMALILVVNILAYESTITVNTGLPDHRIEFRPAHPDTGKSITSIIETSDGSGEVVFNYNLDEMRIKLGFQAFKEGNANSVSFLNGKKAIFFSNVILDKFIDIDLNKQEPTIEVYSGEEVVEEVEEEEVVEEVEEEEVVEEVEEEEQKNTPGITGKAIEGVKNVASSTKTYYILGGLVVLIAVGLFLKKKMNKKAEIKVTKLSEINENKKKIEHTDDELEDAEKKIKEAKEELDEIRDKKKNLREAKEKFERDKEELKRLESDEDTPK
jgi:hypothetical protein